MFICVDVYKRQILYGPKRWGKTMDKKDACQGTGQNCAIAENDRLMETDHYGGWDSLWAIVPKQVCHRSSSLKENS